MPISNIKLFFVWVGVAAISVPLVIIPITQFHHDTRDGLPPDEGISLVYDPNILLFSFDFRVITSLIPNEIEIVYSPSFQNNTQSGIVAIVLPYNGTLLTKENNLTNQSFGGNTVLLKEYRCSVNKSCLNYPEDIVFQLNQQIDSKQSSSHDVRLKFMEGAPSDPSQSYIYQFIKNRQPQLGFLKATNPTVRLIMDETANNMSPPPPTCKPDFFYLKGTNIRNSQMYCSISAGQDAFEMHYEIPTEKNQDSDFFMYESVKSTILGIAGISLSVFLYSIDKKKSSRVNTSYDFTIEKYFENEKEYLRILHPDKTIESCLILRNKEPCKWWDDNSILPRHIRVGGGGNVLLPPDAENINSIITIKSGKHIIRKIKLKDIALTHP